MGCTTYLLDDVVLTDYFPTQSFIVVGIRGTELELEGDWSGGRHNACTKQWYPIEKCTKMGIRKPVSIWFDAKSILPPKKNRLELSERCLVFYLEIVEDERGYYGIAYYDYRTEMWVDLDNVDAVPDLWQTIDKPKL